MLISGLFSFGQSSSVTIHGTLVDDSGALVSGASVTLRFKGETIKTITSNDWGNFSFVNLEPGDYVIEVEVKGFSLFRYHLTIPRPLDKSLAHDINLTMPIGGPVKGAGRNTNPGPPTKQHLTFTDPSWNVWIEPYSSSPSYKPQMSLEPAHTYSLALDIAARAFDKYEGPATYSQGSSPSLSRWLTENSNVDSADLDVLVIPDDRYFQPQILGERLKRLHVDLKKLREVRGTGFDWDDSPLSYLRRNNGEAPFEFGRQLFRLATNSVSESGNGTIAISIWDSNKPVDEISVSLCVLANENDSCPQKPSVNYSLRGVDLAGKSSYPGAALHLIDRGVDMVGVFRCTIEMCSRQYGGYLTWEINKNSDDFAVQIRSIVSRLTPPTDDQHFVQAGKELYGLLFPNPKDPQAKTVKEALSTFLRVSAPTEGTTATVPTFFVRVLPNRPDLVLFPMAMMRVPISSGEEEFVGFRTNVETPLELQDYATFSGCVSKWSFLVPPEPPNPKNPPIGLQDLLIARGMFVDWINAASHFCDHCVHSDIDEFREWLGKDESSAGHAVVILSQHKDNGLFFDRALANPPTISPTSIQRTFEPPSIAIIDACGTSEPGASEFIRTFNMLGVNSVIGTTSAVAPQIAGRFLAILMKLVHDHPNDPKYPIGRARFEAVRTLAQELSPDPKDPKSPLSPQALAFVLAGNASLKVCVPFSSSTVETKPTEVKHD